MKWGKTTMHIQQQGQLTVTIKYFWGKNIWGKSQPYELSGWAVEMACTCLGGLWKFHGTHQWSNLTFWALARSGEWNKTLCNFQSPARPGTLFKKFCDFSKNTFIYKTPPLAASVLKKVIPFYQRISRIIFKIWFSSYSPCRATKQTDFGSFIGSQTHFGRPKPSGESYVTPLLSLCNSPIETSKYFWVNIWCMFHWI